MAKKQMHIKLNVIFKKNYLEYFAWGKMVLIRIGGSGGTAKWRETFNISKDSKSSSVLCICFLVAEL